MTKILVKHDKKAKALYIALDFVPPKRRWALRTRKLAPGVHCDYDAGSGTLVGIEILALDNKTIKVEDVAWDKAEAAYAKREKRRQ
jgi:hypothetical protein